MERTLGKGTYKFLVIYEFLGTAMLLYGINVSPAGNPFGVIYNILAIILVVGPITGAHINPAVSTGVLISCFFDQNLRLICMKNNSHATTATGTSCLRFRFTC